MSSPLSRPNRQFSVSEANTAQLSLTRSNDRVHRVLPNFLDYNATPLQPLVSCDKGEQHAYFPRNLAEFHLLTGEQLDALAFFYHQRDPRVYQSDWYPCPIKPWLGAQNRASFDEETKRYFFGWFIGLYTPENPQPLPNPFHYDSKLDFGESRS